MRSCQRVPAPIFLSGNLSHMQIAAKPKKSQFLIRDGYACVLGNKSHTSVCRIVPFSWNNRQSSIGETRMLLLVTLAFFAVDWLDKNGFSVANSGQPGTSDQVWNMICLDERLRRYWTMTYFALKCVGIDDHDENEAIVKLRFHWIPRGKNLNARCSVIGPDNDLEKMINFAKTFSENDNQPPEWSHGTLYKLHDDGTPLVSGDLFEVRMPMDDAVRFRDMLELQWACMILASLSGSAEALDLSPDPRTEYDSELRTLDWVEEQERRSRAPYTWK